MTVEQHCIVAASRVDGGASVPPTAAELESFTSVAAAYRARLEVLETGVMIAHLSGEARDVARRAARLALQLMHLLWLTKGNVAVSAVEPDASVALQSGKDLLFTAEMTPVYKDHCHPELVAIDPSTTRYLEPEFEFLNDPPMRIVRERPAESSN